MIKLLRSSISQISGVGPARQKQLSKLGINTIRDMLFFFPRDFEDRSKCKKIYEVAHGETVSINAFVQGNINTRRINSSLTVYSVNFADDSGIITAVWYNTPYLKNSIKQGVEYRLYGNISFKYGKKEIISPVFETANKQKSTGRIVPVYPLTASLTQKIISDVAEKSLSVALKEITDPIPQKILNKYSLCSLPFALKNIHFPADYKSLEAARKRLVFEEFFLLSLGLQMMKNKSRAMTATPIKADADKFLSLLPFTATNAQKRVITEIYNDINKKTPMIRLLQGDVGSGKTIVGASMLFAAAENNMQGVLMAPTEILANQHFNNITKMFPHISTVLLTGHLTAKAKREVLEKIKDGSAKIVISTHAVLQDNVEFKNLAVAITDEQHRFGVNQRKTLSEKGTSPHILVMSATPIPRTLSLILYGDLDISILDELPPGREKTDTFAVSENMRERVYTFLKKHTDEGKQGYIVCPLVEESDKNELKNVIDFTASLKEKYFEENQVAFIHGKLPAKDKNAVMESFIKGDIKVLVSTTVIEVGVDVKNACIMIIENAERFGLSQLHQLRGRVGRGGGKSYCIMFSESETAASRLDIMTKTNDGFKIAEKDLQLRGPGEFFGTRQHGLPELKIANMFSDTKLLSLSSEAANNLTAEDPSLSLPENSLLKKRIREMFDSAGPLN